MALYSCVSFLEGKNVMIFDTETTGLPEQIAGVEWGTGKQYYSYKLNEKYENARIVSIAWAFISDYNKDKVLGYKINEYIVLLTEQFSNISDISDCDVYYCE